MRKRLMTLSGLTLGLMLLGAFPALAQTETVTPEEFASSLEEAFDEPGEPGEPDEDDEPN